MCSAIMCFEAGDPLLTQAIDAIAPGESSMQASGEMMLSRVWSASDVRFYHLPYDRDKVRNPAASMWAIHTWNTR